MPDRRSSDFSEAEKKAMRARARELAAEQKANRKKEEGERDVLAAIKAMSGNDRAMGKKIHDLVIANAPELWPKTWYGMPAYSIEGKKVLCFYQSAEKGEARYATFGFNDLAKLDEGNMWPTSFALQRITSREEKMIVSLLKKAIADR